VVSSKDIRILFTTRLIRLFCYGLVSVTLALYLIEAGLSERQVGLLFSLTLAGDAAISLWLTTSADANGRRLILAIGAVLMMASGIVFLVTTNFWLLVAAAVLGVISPSGKEIGPFLSVEQSALSQLVRDSERTRLFAWYNLTGSLAAAFGALSGGWLAGWLEADGMRPLEAYRAALLGYAVGGVILLLLFSGLSSGVEVARRRGGGAVRRILGLHRSQTKVWRLSALFGLDAFGGGLIVQSMLAYWLHVKFGVEAGALGGVFFAVNLLSAASAPVAAWLARRIGLLNTMVFTHVPSNVLLMLIPFMPTAQLAIAMLLLRFSISQMDVPTRQSYTMAVVDPDERSAAAGITTIARSVGAAASPALTGIFLSVPGLLSLPFVLGGGVKLLYDLLLYLGFRNAKPPEELANARGSSAV
jgi:MFS family permease